MKPILVLFSGGVLFLGLCLHLTFAEWQEDSDATDQNISSDQQSLGGFTPIPPHVPQLLPYNFIDNLIDGLSVIGQKILEVITAPPKMMLKVAYELWQHLQAFYAMILYQIKKYFF